MTHALASTTLTDFSSVSGHFTHWWLFALHFASPSQLLSLYQLIQFLTCLRKRSCEVLSLQWRVVMVPFQKRVSFQKARTQTRNLDSFQERECRMERYKDSNHASLVGMQFVLTFVGLSAVVCICFVCRSPVGVGRSFCLSASISVSRPWRVCFLGCVCPCACLVHRV